MKGIFRIEIPVELEETRRDMLTGKPVYDVKDCPLLKDNTVNVGDWIEILKENGMVQIELAGELN